MPRISLLVPERALRLIDDVAANRTAFMIDASVKEARRRRREIQDCEIARVCALTAERDIALSEEFDGTLQDGMAPRSR
jgi:hypothetical protein